MTKPNMSRASRLVSDSRKNFKNVDEIIIIDDDSSDIPDNQNQVPAFVDLNNITQELEEELEANEFTLNIEIEPDTDTETDSNSNPNNVVEITNPNDVVEEENEVTLIDTEPDTDTETDSNSTPNNVVEITSSHNVVEITSLETLRRELQAGSRTPQVSNKRNRSDPHTGTETGSNRNNVVVITSHETLRRELHAGSKTPQVGNRRKRLGPEDDTYAEKRRRNNESAKRSRAAKLARIEALALKVAQLEEENQKLKIALLHKCKHCYGEVVYYSTQV